MADNLIIALRSLGLDNSLVPYALELRYLSWFVYCIFVVETHGSASAFTASNSTPHPAAAFLNCIIRGYGGAILVPILLSAPSPLVQSYIPMTFMSLAFILAKSAYTRDIWLGLTKSRIVQPVIACAVAMHRTASITGWRTRGEDTLKNSVLGAFICGTLGGSGGVFLPLPQGLKRLEAGLPWGLESALMINCFLCVFDARSSLVKGCIFTVLATFRMFPRNRDSIMGGVRSFVAAILGLHTLQESTGRMQGKKKQS